jgi:hypothetical protein
LSFTKAERSVLYTGNTAHSFLALAWPKFRQALARSQSESEQRTQNQVLGGISLSLEFELLPFIFHTICNMQYKMEKYKWRRWWDGVSVCYENEDNNNYY